MKIAIITGGSRGLGASTAIECARKGMGVVVTYNSNPAKADHVVKTIMEIGGKAVALKLDVGDIAAFRLFVTLLPRTCGPSSAGATSTISSIMPDTAPLIRSQL